VRMALGAVRGDVLRLVVGQGVTLAAVGVVIGIVAALGVTQFIKTLLYNVTASDPLSFSVVAVFLGVVAIVASYVPARRAMRVDPIIALRNDWSYPRASPLGLPDTRSRAPLATARSDRVAHSRRSFALII
jgi:putative ABC transport system permease protein